MNDTYMTDLHLKHPPHLIALASMALSASMAKDETSTQPIRDFISDLAIDPIQLSRVLDQIISMYENWNAYKTLLPSVLPKVAKIRLASCTSGSKIK